MPLYLVAFLSLWSSTAHVTLSAHTHTNLINIKDNFDKMLIPDSQHLVNQG